MNSRHLLLLVTIFILFVTGIKAQEKAPDFPLLKGRYLGQNPPGMAPEVFAPGILNNEKMGAFCAVFSPEGNEFYVVHYERKDDTSEGIVWMRRINDVWTKPELLPFNSTTYDNDMCMSADGNMLIFRSYRALPNGKKPKDHTYLWFVERTEDGWSRAKPLHCADVPLRTGYPSLAENRTLYFAHRHDEVTGIYCSKPVNGIYGAPEHVFTAVKGVNTEGDMFVAPDESYMIISCRNHPDNIGSSQGDLYITFMKEDGTWTEEINMGELINTQYGENCPQVSPDGKYFFFNRYDPDANKGNIYWVDARIIEDFKPEKTKKTEIPFRADRLSDHVLFIKSGKSAIMSNSTAVATSRGLVVIDAHYKPECGRIIRRIVEEAFGRNDFSFLVYTHAGVDHMGGARAFPEAIVVGHDNCVTRIEELRERLREVDIRHVLNPRLELLREKINAGPADVAELFKLEEALFYWSELCEFLASGFEYIKPDIMFDEDLAFHLGDVTMKLRYCTPGYSESDILIHIPEEKLLVVGDIFNKDRIPLLNEKSDVRRWLDVFKPFIDGKEEIRHIIGGHDEMMSLAELKDQYEYLRDLWEGVVAAKKEGLTLEKAKERFSFDKRYPHLSHLNICWISTPDDLHERNIEHIWKIAKQQRKEKT